MHARPATQLLGRAPALALPVAWLLVELPVELFVEGVPVLIAVLRRLVVPRIVLRGLVIQEVVGVVLGVALVESVWPESMLASMLA